MSGNVKKDVLKGLYLHLKLSVQCSFQTYSRTVELVGGANIGPKLQGQFCKKKTILGIAFQANIDTLNSKNFSGRAPNMIGGPSGHGTQ